MYHKTKIDVGFLKKGTYVFLSEDQASALVEAGRIEEEGYEVNPDEKSEVISDEAKDDESNSGDDDNNDTSAGKPGRKPKVSTTSNTLK